MDNEKPDNPDKFYYLVRVSLFFMAVSILYLLAYWPPLRAGGQFNQCQSNCKNIGTALQLYYDANEKKYPPALTALTPGYLETIPTCPGSKSSTGYIISYQVSLDFTTFTFFCQGTNHKRMGVDKNYPQYNSSKGLIAR